MSLSYDQSNAFEKIMYFRLLCYFKKNEFRKHHSSFMARMLMMDEITKTLENDEIHDSGLML